MNLAVPPSTAVGSASADPQAALQQAVDDFQSILTDQQRRKLRQIGAICDPDTALIFTSQLGHENRAAHPRVASRFYSVLQCVQAFSSVVDTFVSSHPEIAALVWGSVKMTMLIAVNFTSYFEDLSKLFMTVKNQCPLFAEYQALYPTSKRLQAALCDFHAAIIRCCKHVVEVTQRSVTTVLKKAFFQSFQDEMEPYMQSIRTNGAQVKEEILLAAARAQREDEALQDKERKAASQGRSMLQKFMPRMEKDVSEIRDMQMQQSARKIREERQRLLEWLSPHDFSTTFREACKKRQNGTADWIFDLPEFQSWYQGSAPPLLWCSGKIGSGKTVLCSNVVNYILRNKSRDQRTSFFFVEHGNPESLKAETMIRSIIRQPITLDMSEHVFNKLRRWERAIFIDLNTWVDWLQKIGKGPTFYIIIDGLDECEAVERREILHALSLIFTTATNLRVFLSSRDSVHLDLGGACLKMQRISMTGETLTADIRSFVKQSIQDRLQREELAFGDDELLEEVNDALTRHADGMFLWVTFLIDEICAANCDDDVRQSLRRLPKNLEDTFARSLLRVLSRSRHPELVQKTFRWVAAAKRPLTLDELREAISIEIGQKSWRKGRIPQNLNQIVLWSENLLHMTEEEPIQVQFSHASIRDFITGEATSPQLSKFHVDVAEADHFAGEICVTYLSLSDFTRSIARRQRPIHVKPADITAAVLSQGPKMAHVSGLVTKLAFGGDRAATNANLASVIARCSRDEDREAREMDSSHPFLKYAAKYWLPHTASFDEKTSAVWDLWLHIVSGGPSPAEIPWPESVMRDTTELMNWSLEKQHYALIRYACYHAPRTYPVYGAMNGLIGKGSVEYLARWLRTTEVPLRDINYSFRHACSYEQLKAAKLLLEFGADVNFDCNPSEEGSESRCGTALQAASRIGNVDLINWLLNAGADPNAEQAGRYDEVHHHTSLQEACRNGDLQTVELLLAAGANVNAAACRHGETAIQAASRVGHVDLVKRLLTAGAEVNAAAAECGTGMALPLAFYNDHLEVVCRLVTAGAHVELGPGDGKRRISVRHDEALSWLPRLKSYINDSGENDDHLRTGLQVTYMAFVNALCAADMDFDIILRKGTSSDPKFIQLKEGREILLEERSTRNLGVYSTRTVRLYC